MQHSSKMGALGAFLALGQEAQDRHFAVTQATEVQATRRQDTALEASHLVHEATQQISRQRSFAKGSNA